MDLNEIQTAIAQNPEDMTPRYEYAGRLRELGCGEQAAFIERQLNDHYSLEVPSTFAWAGFKSPSNEIIYEFRRGFVEQVWCPANLLPQIVPLFEKAPILHLNIRPDTTPLDNLPEAFFARLHSLSLGNCGIDDDFVKHILCKRTWDKLQWLSLAFNPNVTV